MICRVKNAAAFSMTPHSACRLRPPLQVPLLGPTPPVGKHFRLANIRFLSCCMPPISPFCFLSRTPGPGQQHQKPPLCGLPGLLRQAVRQIFHRIILLGQTGFSGWQPLQLPSQDVPLIPVWKPCSGLRGKIRSYSKTPSVICSPRLANLSRAHRAAALLHPGSGINEGFPDVAVGALPPDLTMAACGHHLRGKAAIQSGVPLCGYRWFRSGQVIEARQNSLVGTIGATAAAHCAGGNDRLIAVVLFASPPCLPVAVSGDGIRGQGTVSHRIPLLCQLWVLRSQIVEPRQNLLPGTDRATGTGDRPGRDGGLPPVPQRAPPPNLAARFK